MCNERALDDKARAAAIKLRSQRPAFNSPLYAAWEDKVANAIMARGLGGGPVQEFCDLAGVP